MKTLLVTNDFPPKIGGIQSYLFELVNTLSPSSVRVLAPDYPGAREFDARLPYEVIRHPHLLYPTPALLKRICALATDTDVVQFGYALQSWAMAPLMKKRTGVPYVVFVHGAEVLFPLYFRPAASLLMRGALEESSALFAVSRYTAEQVSRHTDNAPRCLHVPPVVDTHRFNPQNSGEGIRGRHGLATDPVVLCVGRLVWRKGQDILIESLPGLTGRFRARLVLVGEGKIEDNLQRRARRLGVEDRVVFCGRVEEEALPGYYAAADVFAMPARDRWRGLEKEGFGVVYAEAGASGLPLVVGRSGGAQEAVEERETGFAVDGNNVAEVEETLASLLNEDKMRRRMGAAARERAGRLHSPQAAGRRYRKALEEASS